MTVGEKKSHVRLRCIEIAPCNGRGRHPYESTSADHSLFLALVDIAVENAMPIDLHVEAAPREKETPEQWRNGVNPDLLKENISGLERLLDASVERYSTPWLLPQSAAYVSIPPWEEHNVVLARIRKLIEHVQMRCLPQLRNRCR